MHHEIVTMKKPELQKNEITLPLIENGCAVQYPPNLVNVKENGLSAAAKFEVCHHLLLYLIY